jgi:hypothetical protein
MTYADAIRATAARRGWTVTEEPAALVVAGPGRSKVRHGLGGEAEAAHDARRGWRTTA